MDSYENASGACNVRVDLKRVGPRMRLSENVQNGIKFWYWSVSATILNMRRESNPMIFDKFTIIIYVTLNVY